MLVFQHFQRPVHFIQDKNVRVYGKLPNLPNMASVSQNRGSQKYFRCSCLAQSRVCILEWSNWAEILVTGLKLEFMAILFFTFYHFDQPLTGWRPPPTRCTAVRVKRAYLPVYMPFIRWNIKLAHFYECMYIGNSAIKWHFVFCHCINVFFW